MRTEEVKQIKELWQEKYNICLKLKQYEKAKKWLIKIKQLEGKNEKSN
jgi:predicted adenine nucleotide alpha hydrolase (AANH) superfamily ATPase